MRGALLFVAASVLAAGAALECNSDSFCDADAQTCDAQADASVPPVSGGGCDSSKPASQGGCAVAESDGYFVSPSGSDSAAGSKAAPFKTIGKGITAAAGDATRPNVYVCQGTYAENLVIQAAPAGVALHGGFDCAEWTQSSAPTTVAPPSGYPLHVLGAAALVESMTLTAPDATDPGGSSIAAFADGSPGMTFRRAAVTGGKAMAGATAAASPALGPNTGGNSNPTSSATGAASVSCPCGTDTTVGGQGGTYGVDGGAAGNGLPTISGMTGGLPGVQGACAGGNGANGASAAANGASTQTYGELTAQGWTSSAGGPGPAGGTAQGGGGGNWNDGNGLGGGGGACGGCGGKGGDAGHGGGASIAIAALNTTLRVQASTIKSGAAGNGGDGAAGQPGQAGGNGGTGAGNQCSGGGGGTGGNGGAGGGGAGGISVAVATNQGSPKPDVDSVSTVLAGTPGHGGHDGSAAQTKAIDGIADTLHSF